MDESSKTWIRVLLDYAMWVLLLSLVMGGKPWRFPPSAKQLLVPESQKLSRY